MHYYENVRLLLIESHLAFSSMNYCRGRCITQHFSNAFLRVSRFIEGYSLRTSVHPCLLYSGRAAGIHIHIGPSNRALSTGMKGFRPVAFSSNCDGCGFSSNCAMLFFLIFL